MYDHPYVAVSAKCVDFTLFWFFQGNKTLQSVLRLLSCNQKVWKLL